MSICLISHCNCIFKNLFPIWCFQHWQYYRYLKSSYLNCHHAWTIDSWDSKNYWSSFPQKDPSRKVWLSWAARDDRIPYTRFYMIDWTCREGERECYAKNYLENNPAPRMRRLGNQLSNKIDFRADSLVTFKNSPIPFYFYCKQSEISNTFLK